MPYSTHAPWLKKFLQAPCMLARVLTLQFDTVVGQFDDTPLRDFLQDKDVLSLREHFFVKNEQPYLVVLVTYTLPHLQPPRGEQAASSPRHRESSWRELVAEADVPLFNTLRNWRLERSKQEGVPPYVICTSCASRHLCRP